MEKVLENKDKIIDLLKDELEYKGSKNDENLDQAVID